MFTFRLENKYISFVCQHIYFKQKIVHIKLRTFIFEFVEEVSIEKHGTQEQKLRDGHVFI